MTSPEFELAMTRTEYDNAIKSLTAASKLAARYQGERDEARAAGRAVEEQLDRANAAITRVLVLLTPETGMAQPLYGGGRFFDEVDIRDALKGES